MKKPVVAAATNLVNRRKALIAGNIALWAFQGLYTVSPIDLIPDILPLIGLADDLFGLMVTVAFTVYTLSVIYRHGFRGLLPGKTDNVVDVAPEGTPALAGYEPMSLDEIRSL